MDSPDMKNSQKPTGPSDKKPEQDPEKKKMIALMLIPIGIYVLFQLFLVPSFEGEKVNYSQFSQMVVNNPETGQLASCELMESLIRCKTITGEQFRVDIALNDLEMIPLLRKNIPNFSIVQPNFFLRYFFQHIIPVFIFIFLLWFFLYRGMQQGGGKLFSFGKSRAKLQGKDKNKVTFENVAGCEEAKEELREIISFLREPEKFQKLGGKIPKGVLLMGPPGTGKTLIAKAVAGEADVPFFTISGSDFVEMFVGVGASRVRDLFEQAKKAAKTGGKGAIIFIDEIDAVGRQRFAGIGGGHDEREQTLNALLVEMDGFDTQLGVILIASTNRPDVLDAALLRPGRFDRQVVVDRPDAKGREAILKVHVKSINLEENASLEKIAKQTVGFTGADIANLVNEAALLAARRDKEKVTFNELQESIEKVMMGPERKSRIVTDREKKITAVHEAGHALVALLIPGTDPVNKVSIIPRGHGIAGYTSYLPKDDSRDISKSSVFQRIKILLGGRVAEKVTFDDITAGASNDLERATGLARAMVCNWGMSEKLGNLTFGKNDEQVFLGRDFGNQRDYSDKTAELIDQEVKDIVEGCYAEVTQMLTDHRDKLDKLADKVLEKETVDGDEIREICGLPAEETTEKDKPSEGSSETEGEDSSS